MSSDSNIITVLRSGVNTLVKPAKHAQKDAADESNVQVFAFRQSRLLVNAIT